MRRTMPLSLAFLLLTTVVLGEDFWVKKEYMQWTSEEVKKLMTDSPWAKDVTISVTPAVFGSSDGQRPAAAASGIDVESTAGSARGRGRGGRGASADNGGGASAPEVLVTLNVSWRSALPLRMATVKSRLGGAAEVPPEAQQLISKDQEDYVIVISGMPVRMARLMQDPVRLGQSTLKFGKKAPLAPKAMDFQTRTQTVDIILVFPKSAPIILDDKDVELDVKLGQIAAKRKFNLKDMVYNGKLEL